MTTIVHTLNPNGVLQPAALYSQVGTVRGPCKLIVTAGQLGVDEHGKAPGSYEEQIKLAIQNLSRCITAAGATTRDIVKLTYYIVNFDARSSDRPHARLLQQFLGDHRPAATLIPVPGLARPECLFEIEAMVAVHDGPVTIAPGHPAENLQGTPEPAKSGGHYDVVVVGAGLSGLQAAADIQIAGLSCVVLEARDRVGGKTWTRETKNGKLVDVGAAWINDTNQSKIHALAKSFGLDLIKQNIDGNCVMQGHATPFAYGDLPKFSEHDRKNIVVIRDLVETLSQSIDITNLDQQKFDDVTFEEFVKSHGAGQLALATATVWTRAMLGCEPSEISALGFLDYCKRGGGLLQMRSDGKGGGQYLRIRQGTQAIAKGIAASLLPGSVVLGSAVTKISQDQCTGAAVYTASGTRYTCRKVIVSIPTPLYRIVSFSPALPPSKTNITSATKLGTYGKAILVFRRPWWRESAFCGLTQSFIGPATVTRDTSDDESGQYSLTCFVVGGPARAYFGQKAVARREQILAQMLSIFGTKHHNDVFEVLDIVEQYWIEEQWSQGAPCPMPGPGILSAYGDNLAKPFGDVHFVGTETADEWKGYMEGAVRSGERGAKDVIRAIGKKNDRGGARL